MNESSLLSSLFTEESPSADETKDFEILNGFPMYKENHVLAGRCKIFERIGWDDTVGPTYLAVGPENKELVLRLGNDSHPTVKIEAAFLCEAERQHQWPLFSQVHSIFYHDDFTFLALYFRGGPTLEECFNFAGRKLSHGSAGRLAEDLFIILRTIHRMGYLTRCLDLSQFHFDAASRHLFMADISTLRKATTEMKMTWIGGPFFAPLSFHLDQSLYERDEIEAWFYLFVHFIKELPWYGHRIDDIRWEKVATDLLLNGLPSQFRQIYEIIDGEPSDRPISDEEHKRILSLVKEIHLITDEESNFDFERDPFPDEQPCFVAERVEQSQKKVIPK